MKLFLKVLAGIGGVLLVIGAIVVICCLVAAVLAWPLMLVVGAIASQTDIQPWSYQLSFFVVLVVVIIGTALGKSAS